MNARESVISAALAIASAAETLEATIVDTSPAGQLDPYEAATAVAALAYLRRAAFELQALRARQDAKPRSKTHARRRKA